MQSIPDFVHEKLEDDEEILWAGKPAPMAMALKVLLEALFFASLFFFVTLKALQAAPSDGGDTFSTEDMVIKVVITLIFASIGFYFLAKPFLAYKDAEKTSYYVSNQRALQFVKKKKVKVTSHRRNAMNVYERQDKKNGKTNIVYAIEKRTTRRNGRRSTTITKHGFYGIEDADGAEKALRVMKNALKSAKPKSAFSDYDPTDDQMRALR